MFLYKNMSIFREFFKTQSDQNIHQNALNCTKSLKFLGELAYFPEQLNIRATIINMYFYMKIVIFYLRLFQNTHQNATIVKRFQTFLYKNYPIASVYLYKKWYFLNFVYKK